MFEIEACDCLARTGKLHTRKGVVHTPALLPVFNPNVSLLKTEDVLKIVKPEIVITNAYILHKSKHIAKKALAEGVQSVLEFDGPVMTDSGAFQAYEYDKIRISPSGILAFQKNIGSDIITILDVVTPLSASYETAKKSIQTTFSRAGAAAKKLEGENILLACPVQGGLYLDLRSQAAKTLSQIDCAVNPIGGVVPLLEAYRFAEIVDIIVSVKKHLTPSRVVHLFGAGHPLIFPLAVLLGCDLFDSASYAKYARTDRLIFRDCTRHLDSIQYLACTCPICAKYELEGLKTMQKNERQKAIELHNLYTSFSILQELKCAIQEGTIWEYVEMHCRSHPALLSALKKLKEYSAFFERYEPLSRNTGFFYLCPESVYRPAVYRVQKRILDVYRKTNVKKGVLLELFDNDFKKAAKIARKLSEFDTPLFLKTIFGIVPFELADIYPVGQAVLPAQLDKDAIEDATEYANRFFENTGIAVLPWNEKQTIACLKCKKPVLSDDLKKLKAIFSYQFCRAAADILLSGNIKIVKSPRTKKIRNIYRDGEHILSLRAYDTFFTLKPAGARILHASCKPPLYRAIVKSETADFNRAGKNVFAKFVVSCDTNLVPGDETLVVDEDDELVAIGRAALSGAEMCHFKAGIAVRVREGIKV